MTKITNTQRKVLAILLLVYGAASLLHFIHNAEYLADYPNLPTSWTRGDVYVGWLGLTAVGVTGWLVLNRGFVRTGLLILVAYSALGLDSLGHYLLAPMSAHTVAMNTSILTEVAAAAALLMFVLRALSRRARI